MLSVLSLQAQQYNIKRYSIEEGLSRSGVYDLLEDSKGFLWVATEGGGVDVFDGQHFKNYSTVNGLPTNVVRCLFEDKDGNMWFGTESKGAIKFDGQVFTTYDKGKRMPSNEVRSIQQGNDGLIWFATLGGGIAKLNPKSDSLKYLNQKDGLPSNKCRALLKDSQGNIWIGTDGGLAKSTGNHLEVFQYNHKLPDARILCLFEDDAQNIWIGTRNGVAKFSPKSESIEVFTEKDGLIQNRIRGIGQDRLGNMWFGTRIGLSKFDGKRFYDFTEQQGLSNNRIRKILLDASGSLWFGTYFGGIDQFSDETFVHFTEKDGLISHQVFAIQPDKATRSIWLGTFEGLEQIFFHADGKLKDIRVFPELEEQQIFALAKSPESPVILAGTGNGLLLFDGNTSQIIDEEKGLIGNEVHTIFMENRNVYWVGTNKGLSRLELEGRASAKKTKFQIKNFLAGKPVFSIYQDRKKRLWIGQSEGSIFMFQDQIPVEIKLRERKDKVWEKVIFHNVLEILEDKLGNIWLSTEGDGLVRIDNFDNINDSLRFQVYSVAHELTSNFIHLMVFDLEGNLWLGSEKGLDKIMFDDEQNIVRIRHTSKQEGFTGIETNKHAVALDWDKNIWFGTIKGMTRYKPVADSKNQTSPQIHITNVSLSLLGTNWQLPENKVLHQGVEGRFLLPQKLVLPYWDNDLIFDFTGISLKMPHKVEYQWMLEGYDYDWNAPSKKMEIMYANLPHGEYIFKVKSSNEDGVWNTEPAEFHFKVEAPFWKEYWFYAVFVVGTYLLFYTFFRWRTKRLEVAKKKLEDLVEERTSEISEKNVALEQQKEELHTTLEHIQMQKETIESERDKSEQLLLNILPKATAQELREQGSATPKFYEQVTIMFTDFKGFTKVAEKLSPTELVKELEQCFLGFDEILDKYDLEKIKTIGDSYMCAGGVPIANKTNPEDAVRAGLEIQHWMERWKVSQQAQNKPFWDVRIGINTGEVVAGVVGKKKFAYDIWGDAVNLASRMESSGAPNRVNISAFTYQLVKDKFHCEYRGKVMAKNKGEVDMYFVSGEIEHED